MTEAFEKWAQEQLGHDGKHEGFFWLRAFVVEVRCKVKKCPTVYQSGWDAVCLQEEFEKLIREFGLEETR